MSAIFIALHDKESDSLSFPCFVDETGEAPDPASEEVRAKKSRALTSRLFGYSGKEAVGGLLFSRSERVHPGNQGVGHPRLYPYLSFAGEAANKTFTGEKQGFVSANLGYSVVEAARERHDIPGVDDIVARDIDLYHCAIRVEPEIAFTAAADQEQALARKKSFCQPLPFCFQRYVGI